MEDVYATLKTLPFVDASTIETSLMPRDGLESTYICPGIDRPYCGRAIFYTSILRDLQVPRPHDLTLNMAVDRLGPPDYIVYDKYFSVNSCSIELYWPDKGIQVASFDSDSIIRCQAVAANQGLDPDALVSSLLYYSTQDEFTVECCGEMSDVRIPWPGFAK
ncbi:MAG TPA: hypothetical protein VMP08_24425 [Anaerolineae bacterium]|nr:hypothetical protein [Anaerolineae bacterium]